MTAVSYQENQSAILNALAQRFKKLEQDAVRTDTTLAACDKQIADILAETKDKFGVDNIDDLRQRYFDNVEANAQALQKFDEDLTAVEDALAAIEAQAQQ
jgi:hypothetical protein